MRPVSLFDIDQVTRSLMLLSTRETVRQTDLIMQRAVIADNYRKRFRRAHPEFGSGTLASAIVAPIGTDLNWCTQSYLETLLLVVAGLLETQKGDHKL